MADIRINALTSTAATTASDDYLAVDGSANGTRKLSAFSPTFGGNLTVSGTGTTTFNGNTLFNPSTAGNNYTLWKSGSVLVGGIGDGTAFGTTANDFVVHGYTGSTKIYSNSALAATFTSSGNLTVSGTGTSSFAGGLNILSNSSATGAVDIGADARASNLRLSLNAAAGNDREIITYTAGLQRWKIGVTGTAESGSNAGSNWILQAYADNGSTSLGNAISITRSTLATTLSGNLTVSGTGGITSSSVSPLLKATTSALGAVPKLTLENTNLGAWNVYLSGTDGGDFKIDQDSTNKFRIAFGTGNTTFSGNLTVSGGTATISKSSTTTGPVLQLENTNDAIDAGGTLGRLQFYSGDDSGGGNSVRAWIDSIQTTTTPVGSALRFAVANGANAAGEVVRIAETGNFLINTAIDGGQKLQVSGTAIVSAKTSTATASSFVLGDDLAITTNSGRSKMTLGSTNSVSEILLGQTSSNCLVLQWEYAANVANARGLIGTYNYSNPIAILASGVTIGTGPSATTALTLDSSQNATFAGAVQITTNASSVSRKLVIFDSSSANNTQGIEFSNTTLGSSGSSAYIRAIRTSSSGSNTDLTFGTMLSGVVSEVLKLDSSQNATFAGKSNFNRSGGTPTYNSDCTIKSYGAGVGSLELNTLDGTDFVQFANGATLKGNIIARESGATLRISTGTSVALALTTTGSDTNGVRIDTSGNLIAKLNGTAPLLGTNSTMTFERTSDTSLKILVRGSDGITRSVALTLA